MNFGVDFWISAVLLGVGLAMDAFCVSMANGLNEPEMKKTKTCIVAGTFCLYQILMPLIGWICVHTLYKQFESFQVFIPWIALVLLLYIGGKMLLEGFGKKEENVEKTKLGFKLLMLQGIATSIDALSVGFTIADYEWAAALIEALVIGIVTFVLCVIGVIIGKKVGTVLSKKASILGGIVLISIGLKIFISGVIIK